MIDHRLVLGLVGLVGRICFSRNFSSLVVEKFRLLVVDQISNPIFFQFLVVVDVTCMLFSNNFSIFQFDNFWNVKRLEVFFGGLLHSIESDGMSNLSESRNRCRPNIRRLGASSMHYACIVHDVVHSSQFRIFVPFLFGINKQTENCLFLV